MTMKPGKKKEELEVSSSKRATEREGQKGKLTEEHRDELDDRRFESFVEDLIHIEERSQVSSKNCAKREREEDKRWK